MLRETSSKINQVRTGHSFYGEYYSSFVPSENVDCPCGYPLQTRLHLIAECPKYEPYRDTLREVSQDIALPEILGTKEGILALAKFLTKSGAFTKGGAPTKPPPIPTWEGEPEPNDGEENA
jgi:hypothetical protein